MKIKKILCCVDTDPLADAVFDYAVDLAQSLQAQLGLVSVVDQKLLQVGDTGIDIGTLRNSFKEEIYQLFERLAKRSPELSIVKFSQEGDPRNMILEVANEWNTDLIVIASHGRTGISRFLMGSVAESVLRHSKCPVLIVPAGK